MGSPAWYRRLSAARAEGHLWSWPTALADRAGAAVAQEEAVVWPWADFRW